MNRRTLAKGAAWAAPVIVLGSQVPAFAASPVPCPNVPTPTAWTTSTSGTAGGTNTGGYGWTSTTPYSFSEVQDNGSSTTIFTVTTTTSVSVTAGVTYTLNTNVTFNYGSNNASRSTGQTVSLTMGGAQIFSYTTRVAPLVTAYSTVAASGTYTATSTGLVPLTFSFAVQPPGNGGNDDVTVTLPTFSSCIAT